mmetsp:Transcript_7250/g.15062  ORF Transcript_7250/g.15062 Transcript_7250/m.15062 type:complete len:273 (+) Transcript_7250:210-1028(+)
MAILLTENLKVEHVEVREERGHRVAVVRLDAAGEERNRARDLGLRKERHDADLREAAVVDLGDEALSLLLRRGVLRQVERVEEVERDRVRDLHVAVVHERRVHARLAALHVVRVERALAPELKERDDRDNLPLGRERDRVPLGLRGAAGERRHVTLEGLRPRELDAVGAREVADERSHGNTAVLDLGVAEPANGGLVGRAKSSPRLGRPEGLVGEAERVPERNHRVELLGERLEVSLGLRHDDAGGRLGDRGLEGRGGADEGEGEDDLGEHD